MMLLIGIITLYIIFSLIGVVYISNEINKYKDFEVKDDLYYKRKSIWEELTNKYTSGRK